MIQKCNHTWILWLHELEPYQRRRILADELFYFDAWMTGNMSIEEVLRHSMDATYALSLAVI